jgi:hypothetical protein
MEIETKSLLASLGTSESLLGLLLFAGALLIFRTTLFGESLQHIPLVGEELAKKERIQAFQRGQKDVLAQGYKMVNFYSVLTLAKLRCVSVQINLPCGHS